MFGGGGGASARQIRIQVLLNAQQALINLTTLANGANLSDQRLRALGNSINSVTRVIQTLNGSAASAGRNLRGIAVGVGGFYMIHQAMMASRQAVTSSIKGAMDLEMAMARLELQTGSTANQMKEYLNAAELAGAATGPLEVTDILKAQEYLNRGVVGMSHELAVKLSTPMAKFMSQIGIMSKGQIDPDIAAESARQFFQMTMGGLTGPNPYKEAVKGLDLLSGAAMYTGPENIQSLLMGMRVLGPMGKAMQIPVDQSVFMGVLRQLYPVGGGRAIGKDIAQLIEFSLNPMMGKKDKSGDRAKLLEELGLTVGGKSTAITASGGFDIFKFLMSLNRAAQGIRARYDTKDERGELMKRITEAFKGTDMAKRLSLIALDPDFPKSMDAIEQQLKRLSAGGFLDKANDRAMKTLYGQVERLTSNIATAIDRSFLIPNSLLMKIVQKMADLSETGIKLVQSDPDLFGGLVSGSVIAGAGGLFMMVAGAFLRSLTMYIAGAAPGFAATVVGFIGGALATVGLWVTLGGIIAATITAAMTLWFHLHPESFNKAMETLKSMFQAFKDILEWGSANMGAHIQRFGMELVNKVIGTFKSLPMLVAMKATSALSGIPLGPDEYKLLAKIGKGPFSTKDLNEITKNTEDFYKFMHGKRLIHQYEKLPERLLAWRGRKPGPAPRGPYAETFGDRYPPNPNPAPNSGSKFNPSDHGGPDRAQTTRIMRNMIAETLNEAMRSTRGSASPSRGVPGISYPR